MKAILKNVLYIAPEQRTYEGKTYYKVKVVDDLGTFDTLEISIGMEDLNGLPQLRSRVDVEIEVVQRNNKVYLQNPVFRVIDSAASTQPASASKPA